MDVSGVPNKLALLSLLQRDPKMIAFEGWDRYGTPKLSDSAQMQTWRTAQQLPFYDEEIERLLLQISNTALKGSPQERGFGGYQATTKYSRPDLKFLPQASPSYLTPKQMRLQGNAVREQLPQEGNALLDALNRLRR